MRNLGKSGAGAGLARDEELAALQRRVAELEADETAWRRSERLLHALNRAALAMAQAVAPAEIFTAAMNVFRELGYNCTVFLTDEQRQRLFPRYLSHSSGVIQAAEKVAGVKTENFSIVVEEVDFYRRVVREKETIFLEDPVEAMRQILPAPARPFAAQIARILKMERFIAAPLIVENQVEGIFCVYSDELTPAERPLITAFANQMSAAWNKARLYEQAQREIVERRRVEETLRESEARYRSLVETSPDSIVLTDLEGRIIMANRQTAKLYGFESSEELIGRSAFDFAAPEDLERALENVSITLKDGSIRDVEYRVLKRDGSSAVIELRASTVTDAEGQPIAFLGFTRDVTERKRAEDALRRARQDWEEIFQAIGHPTLILDLEHRILNANRAAARATGRSAEELRGLRCYDIFHASASSPPPCCPLETLLQSNEVATVEMRMEALDGVYLVSCTPVFDDQGRLEKVIHIATEITERVRAERELEDTRRLLQAVVDQSPAPIVVVTTADQVIRHFNPAAAALLGVEDEPSYVGLTLREAMARQTWQDIWPNGRPVDPNEIPLARALRGEATPGTEYHVRCRDGAERWFWATGAPIYNQAGELIAGMIIFPDITERRQLLAQIEEQARRVQQIIEATPEGVILLDAEARLILTNPLGEAYLATLAGARVGETLTRLGDHPLSEFLTSPPRGLWHELAAGNGRYQVIARSLETGPTAGGWVVIIRDVTRQREFEQRVQQQERLAAVGQLAAGIAHDFNNIMATIVLYAQMTARAKDLPMHIRERMETIDEQAKHATRLIQQILDFSRRATLDRRPFDLLPLLKEQVKMLERTFPENIELKLSYGADDYTVNADPTRIQQMVLNLALNARDAMPSGGRLQIGLERVRDANQQEEWVRIEVADTGTGIADDVLPHIYEPFFTTKQPGQGNGLGLSQVHGIVGAHDGRIEVQTRVGEGTTFSVYLPALASAGPDAALSPLRYGNVGEGLPRGRGETILVVEDNRVTRTAVVESLELLNYRVMEAGEGREALAILEQYGDEIALVLSDVVMPGMGGVALLHTLRQRGLAVKVVFLTGHPLEKDHFLADESVEYLLKPPNLEQLAGVLHRALNPQLHK